MQERTGRIEEASTIVDELQKEPKAKNKSMRGKWVEVPPKDAGAVRTMNRKQRRTWLAQQRHMGRRFKEIEIP